MTEAFTEDLHRELKRTEKEYEAQEESMRRMDSKDFNRDDLEKAISTCSPRCWDALQSALALRDWLEAGKQIENILYEALTEKEL